MENDEKKSIEIPSIITVKDFADKLDVPVVEVISALMSSGVLATVNDSIDYETASIVALDFSFEVTPEKENEASKVAEEKEVVNDKNLQSRSPVVTVMGHVDHGKTTLLDNIRKAHVTEGESGGITQHISAYQLTLTGSKKKEVNGKTITFIDTPGHAAFSAIRSHGTVITDIIVLIVAANDGVMPQTKEVIKQAEVNKVPIIVAINKTDLPDSDIQKTKQQLAELGLNPEDWGGKTVMVEVSATTGKGIDDLLEMIVLKADMMDLKASYEEDALGVVIESHMHKGAGALAVILIENGTLRRGDIVQVGSAWGRVRILEDFTENKIEEATPSMPVRIAGLKSLPDFGDKLIVLPSEKEAKEAALKSKKSKDKKNVATAKKIGIEDVAEDIKSGKVDELNIVLKADVSGSLEAIKKSIYEIDTKEITLNIVSEGIGAISESDVSLAKATKAIVLGFRVLELFAAVKIASKDKILVKKYDVIYKLLDDLKGVLSGMLKPDIVEKELGKGKVLEIFRDDKKGLVAGGVLKDGKAEIGDEIKIFQDKDEKYRDKILSLRREKDEVKLVDAGQEFGFGLQAHAKISVGDKFVIFKTEEVERKID